VITYTCQICKNTFPPSDFLVLSSHVCTNCKSEKDNLAKENKKRCSRCKKIKDLSEFYGKKKKNCHCKSCCSDLKKEYWKKIKEERSPKDSLYYKTHRAQCERKDRNNHYKSTYGITLKEYEEMHDSQNGVCAICGKINSNNKLLFVDHCHTTGKVRGLLCDKCNSGLGFFRDNISLLLAAIEYLNK
jgi:hypothetical protein